jgi:hypothetical protein
LPTPINPDSKEEQDDPDPSDLRLDVELLINRDEPELDSRLSLDSLRLKLISSSKLLPLLHCINSPSPSPSASTLYPLPLITLNPPNGSKNTGNFSIGSLNQLLPNTSVKDLSAGNSLTA